MGRPLNKKYFGNRNQGADGYQVDESAGGSANAQNYADDRIGGEGLASVTNGNTGSININDTYKTFPNLLASAPGIPGGVTALVQVTWEIESISIGGTNTGYTNSQTGVAATLTGLGGSIITPTFTINTNGTGNVSAINITNRGSWTSIDGTGITTGYSINGAGGTNAMATVKFRIKSIAVTEKGSGYVTAPSLSWSVVNGGTMPDAQTPSLTVDTGAVGSATNQENAILMTARLTGGSAQIVDIIRQVSTNRYKVTDGTRVGIVTLKSSVATAAGEGSVRLVDTDGGTYFATKLTAHKATITRGTGTQAAFTTGSAVKWNMDAATADSLLIDNA
jgi:hypothetical protein